MSEYIKDSTRPLGWRTISYDNEKAKEGAAADSSNLNPDAMNEDFIEVDEE